jgi:CubicO group peptidase (beta-lactamase class C family)
MTLSLKTAFGVVIGMLGAFALPIGARAQSADTAAIIAHIEADVPEAIVSQRTRPRPLQSLMAAQKIPAVSVAVFRDGQLAWTKAWGVTDVVTRTPATPATLFQAASISKPVTALGAMALVSDGTLNLEADVSKTITGWQVPNPITLRQLLSHTAGLSVSGFDGYEIGKPLPSLIQILNGKAPANSAPVVLQGEPGTAFNYSGGGYSVLQALMVQTSGKSFPVLMKERVLDPLDMRESRFDQPLPDSFIPLAAKGHQQGVVIAGGYHIYPEMAAAGLWTTPRDLGKVALEVQNARRNTGRGVLTPTTAAQILTPQVGGYGLGFSLDSPNGSAVFKHSGLNEGFETLMVASAADSGPRTIIVVMTNGQGGSNIAGGVVRAVAREYGWAAYAPKRVVETRLSVGQLAAYEGLYQSGDTSVALEMLGGVLHVRDGNWMRAPMIATGPGRFSVQNRPFDLAIATQASPFRMTMSEGTKSTQFTRIERPFASLGAQVPLLRGTMNGWTAASPFTKSGPHSWTLNLRLAAGSHEFKIASADWAALNLGGALGAEEIALGSAVRLAPMGENLKITLAQAMTVQLEIDARDERRPTLTVLPPPR